MFRHLGERERVGFILAGVVFFLGAGYVGAVRFRQPSPVVIQSMAPGAVPSAVQFGANRNHAKVDALATPTDAKPLIVDVTGAVQHPGLVHLSPGARVNDAVMAAGGARTDADLEYVNLAEKVIDGQMVRIPRRGNHESAPESSESIVTSSHEVRVSKAAKGKGSKKLGPAEPVSLNEASAEQLQAIPGIGPATADRIIAYRQEHGGFRSVEELASVKGIGESKAAKMTPWLRL